LASAGFTVVGPAYTAKKALDLIASCGCDVAVLDVNLGQETSEAVAENLKSKDTPFVIVSGTPLASIPATYRGMSALTKPVRFQLLIATLRNLAAEQGA
jgi:DNA-binding NarL/FixJ family response regulator